MEVPTLPQTGNPILGAIYCIFSIMSSIMAWVSLQQTQMILAIVASIAATVSAIFGARYFYYSTVEKQQNIKKNKTS